MNLLELLQMLNQVLVTMCRSKREDSFAQFSSICVIVCTDWPTYKVKQVVVKDILILDMLSYLWNI